MTSNRSRGYIELILVCLFVSSCSKPNRIYINLKQNAIISCDGTGFKRLTIETKYENIILEGTDQIIYFNKYNRFTNVSVNGTDTSDFVLKLKPCTNYILSKDNGYDRGPMTITFLTDNSGKVTKASQSQCDDTINEY